MDHTDNQQNDTALLYQYIKTLQMENLRRNEQRIYLQSEIEQMRLHIQAMQQQYTSPIKQLNALKSELELLSVQKRKAVQNLDQQKRKKCNVEIQLKAFKQQNEKLKQIVQKGDCRAQYNKNKLKSTECFQRQKQRSLTTFTDHSVMNFRLQHQEYERIRSQTQQALTKRFKQKRSQQIRKQSQQHKLVLQKINQEYEQIVSKLKKEVGQSLKKNQMAQKALNEANIKCAKLQRMQAIIPQLTETLKIQKMEKQKYKMKFNEEKQLTASMKARVKSMQIQNKKLRQQVQQQLQANQSSSKSSASMRKLQEKHSKQKQELQFEKERLLDQVAKSKQELRQNYQYLQREKQAIISKNRDSENKLKIEINLLKSRIQKLQKDLIEKSKQLQVIRQQNVQNMKALQANLAQRPVRSDKQAQKTIDQLQKSIQQKDFQIRCLKNQFQENLKYTETLQESHKKLRGQILSGVNRVSKQRQFLEQIRNLKKQNSELKVQNKSRNSSMSASKRRNASTAKSTASKQVSHGKNQTVKCSQFKQDKIFKIVLNGDKEQISISTIQCLDSMRSSSGEASFFFANFPTKQKQNELQNSIQKNQSTISLHSKQKVQAQEIDSPVFPNHLYTNQSDQKLVNRSQKSMKKIIGTNEQCQNQNRNVSPTEIFGCLKQRIQKLRKKHYLNNSNTLNSVPSFQNIENIDKSVERFYCQKNKIKKIRN